MFGEVGEEHGQGVGIGLFRILGNFESASEILPMGDGEDHGG